MLSLLSRDTTHNVEQGALELWLIHVHSKKLIQNTLRLPEYIIFINNMDHQNSTKAF